MRLYTKPTSPNVFPGLTVSIPIIKHSYVIFVKILALADGFPT